MCQLHRDDSRKRDVELISGRARRALSEVVPGHLVYGISDMEITETISLWGDDSPQIWNAMQNPYGPGIAVVRSTFDAALRSAAATAGVWLLGGHHVQHVERTMHGWRLHAKVGDGHTELCAEKLVLATGRDARDLLGREPRRIDNRLVYTSTMVPAAGSPRHAFFLELTEHGWWYALPHPSGDSFLGYCSERRQAVRRGPPVHAIFMNAIERASLIRGLVRPNGSPPVVQGRRAGMQRFDHACGEGWIAVGDAAFAPDPLSGLGCEFAIASSLQAARVLLRSASLVAMAEYEQRVREFSELHRLQGAKYYAE